MKNLKLYLSVTALCFSTEAFSLDYVDNYFRVNATMQPACIVNARDITFGNYNFQSESNTVSTVYILCNKGVRYNVSLNGGNNLFNGTQRAMLLNEIENRESGYVSDFEKLPYSVSLNQTMYPHFFNGENGTETIVGVGLPSNNRAGSDGEFYILYSKIESGITIKSGLYSDQLTLHLHY